MDTAQLEQAANNIVIAGYVAYRNSLVGNPAPIVAKYFARVNDPRPGDLVMEVSSFALRENNGTMHNVLGTLKALRVETVAFDQEPGYEIEYYSEKAWYIENYVTGETVRWVNASFIAIPRTMDEVRDWEGRA